MAKKKEGTRGQGQTATNNYNSWYYCIILFHVLCIELVAARVAVASCWCSWCNHNLGCLSSRGCYPTFLISPNALCLVKVQYYRHDFALRSVLIIIKLFNYFNVSMEDFNSPKSTPK